MSLHTFGFRLWHIPYGCTTGYIVISVHIVFNVTLWKWVTCVQIRKIWRPSEFHYSRLWVLRTKMWSPKRSFRTSKTFLDPMGYSSVLHEPHHVEIRITFNNEDETFSSHPAVNEYWTDYSVTGQCTTQSHMLRMERLLDCEIKILCFSNEPILLIDKPI